MLTCATKSLSTLTCAACCDLFLYSAVFAQILLAGPDLNARRQEGYRTPPTTRRCDQPSLELLAAQARNGWFERTSLLDPSALFLHGFGLVPTVEVNIAIRMTTIEKLLMHWVMTNICAQTVVA